MIKLEVIGNLINLRNLYASRKKFTELPESIVNVTNLNQVHIDYKKLAKLSGHLSIEDLREAVNNDGIGQASHLFIQAIQNNNS